MEISILHVVKNLGEKIEREKIKLLRLNSLVRKCNSEIDGMPHAHKGSSRVEQLAAAIVDCSNRIKDLSLIRVDCRIELAVWLDTYVTDKAQNQILFLRYGMCKPFAVIARELGYSESSVFRLHRLGLHTLQIKQTLSEIWEFDSCITVA